MDVKRSDWAAPLTVQPRRVLLVLAYGAVLVTLSPALRANQWAVLPLVVGMALGGTLLYAREGIFVVTDHCEACGERSYVGSLWCEQLETVRTAFSRPLLQAVVATALFLLIGAAAGAFRTILLSLSVDGGALRTYLLSDGYGLFRAYFFVYAMVASVPVPVALGNLVRLVLRAGRIDADQTG